MCRLRVQTLSVFFHLLVFHHVSAYPDLPRSPFCYMSHDFWGGKYYQAASGTQKV